MMSITKAAQTAKKAISALKRMLCVSSWKEALLVLEDRHEVNQVIQALQFLVFARVGALTVLLIFSAWAVFSHAIEIALPPHFIFWPIALAYGASLANLYFLKRSQNISRLAYGQLLIDVILATFVMAVTHSSGGIIIYLIAIAGAGYVLSSRGALIIGALSGLSYACCLLLIYPVTTTVNYLDVFGAYVAMVVFAILSSITEKSYSRLHQAAKEHESTLSAFSRQHQQLFDDISEGLITTDAQYAVTGLNKTARRFLGISKTDSEILIGHPLLHVMKQCGVDAAHLSLEPNSGKTLELTIQKKGSEEQAKLSYIVRSLTDEDDQLTGYMIILNDISHIKNIEERLWFHEQMTKLIAKTPSALTPLPSDTADPVEMIGESGIIKAVYTLVGRVAQSEASVLITGESGTGKELIARSIHYRGVRKNKPFIAVNCGAIPEALIESELFGHKKGSFTGAISDHIGLFRQADGGTLFLDEIGELPLALQAKLLRVIQDKRVRAVGDVHEYPIDVRLVSATNRDLRKEIQNERFREDLYYRLNVVNIVTPPLRDRKEDIPLLVHYFIGKHSDADQILPRISPEALQALVAYSFPGNIRELENLIERALVLGGHAILPEHLPPEIRASANISPSQIIAATKNHQPQEQTKISVLPIDLEELLSRIEQEYLNKALEQTGGAKKQAAALLGLNFRSFRYRLKKYNLSDSADE